MYTEPLSSFLESFHFTSQPVHYFCIGVPLTTAGPALEFLRKGSRGQCQRCDSHYLSLHKRMFPSVGHLPTSDLHLLCSEF